VIATHTAQRQTADVLAAFALAEGRLERSIPLDSWESPTAEPASRVGTAVHHAKLALKALRDPYAM
jgi:hypothetical protein